MKKYSENFIRTIFTDFFWTYLFYMINQFTSVIFSRDAALVAPQLTGTGPLAHWLNGYWLTGSLAHDMSLSSWNSGFLAFCIFGILVSLLCWFCSAPTGSAFSDSLLAQNDLSFSIGRDNDVIVVVFLGKTMLFQPNFCHCSRCIHLGWLNKILIWLHCHCSRDLAQLFLITWFYYASSTLLLRGKHNSTRNPVKIVPGNWFLQFIWTLFTETIQSIIPSL